MDDDARRSYGDTPVGFGRKPGIVVVDVQTGFTQEGYPLGGVPLIKRAVENTQRLLEAARRAEVPVATCDTSHRSERELPHRKERRYIDVTDAESRLDRIEQWRMRHAA